MQLYVLSILLVVLSNVLYHIFAKSIPLNANPFSALLVTYLSAFILTLIGFFIFKDEKGFLQSFKDVNWSSIALGASVVGLEMGYLMAYRAGWNISVASIVSNIFLALLLIPVGVFMFHEGFSVTKFLGVGICIFGLVLLNLK